MSEGYVKEFSKTRICYFENQLSTLNADNTNDLTILTSPTTAANHNYDIVRIPAVGTGTGGGHGWHKIPDNFWPLYMTPGEAQILEEHCDAIIPEAVDITAAHIIPTAQYTMGTTAQTQLSFNNTIFAMVAENTDTDHVSHGKEFANPDAVFNFARTYDGGQYYNASDRNVLPQPDILFKIPVYPDTTGDGSKYDERPTYSFVLGANTTLATANIANLIPQQETYTKNVLKHAYMPEFLQNNEKVKLLYPGENQDVYHKTPNGAAAVDFKRIQFGEHPNERSAHNWYHNVRGFSENNLENSWFACTPVNPSVCGPNSYVNAGEGGWTEGGAQTDELTQRRQCGRTYNDLFTNNWSDIWIKGVPILSGSNNVIPHSFMCTITWTMKVKCIPRKEAICRPYQWDIVTPLKEIINEVSTGANKRIVKHTLTGNTPSWIMNEHLWTRLTPRLRPPEILSAANATERRAVASTNLSVFLQPEVDPKTVSMSAHIDLPTRTNFKAGIAATTLRNGKIIKKTGVKRKASPPKATSTKKTKESQTTTSSSQAVDDVIEEVSQVVPDDSAI